MNIKTVEVEYIEKGTFQGGEEDCSNAEIEREENCVVIKQSHWENICKALNKLAEYDGESIWMDDRDDAADNMLEIARNAQSGKFEA